MPRAINIFLVRHAVSEANLDKAVNARLPDNQVPLAEIGHDQAFKAGDALAEWLATSGNNFSGKTRILCSPYRRTRETEQGIQKGLVNGGIGFDRREELALREISFGLFDGLDDDEIPQHFPREHAHYQKHVDFEGEFYAAMPMGESRVQVADRVKGVFGTIIRDNQNGIKNFIIVSHGVTIRTFIMQWMHFSPEWYDAQKNPANASITRIWSNGETPYMVDTIFKGFSHVRSKQDVREEASEVGMK